MVRAERGSWWGGGRAGEASETQRRERRQELLPDGTCAVKNRVVRGWFLHLCACAQEGANTAGAAWLLEPEIRNTVLEMVELR